jgi:signal transduction histidine kinase/ActR/RegA family two-component response regulator/HAMP domain-containing protein
MPLRVRIADWPLRTKMAVLLLVASLLPMLAVNWLSIRQIRSMLMQDSAELLEARGDEVVGRIDTLVSGYQTGVARMAASPNVARILDATAPGSQTQRAQFRALLDAWPQSDSNLRGVAVLDRQGVVVVATEPALEGKSLMHRPFVARALRGESVVSDPYRDEPETGYAPTLALIAPMRAPDGTLRGLAAFWVRASALSSILSESNGQAGPGSFAIVFDQLGIRIAHSYIDELVFRPGVRLEASTIDALVAEQRFGPQTRSLLEDTRPMSEGFRLGGAGPPGPAVFRGFAPGNAQWNFVVARQCRTVQWTVYYLVPEIVVQANIASATRQQMPLGVLIMALALLAGAGCAAYIVRPLRQLTGGARALAGGDFSARVSIGSRDELGQLGASFNDMAARIQEQSAALLHDTEQRYRQLFEALKEGFCAVEVIFDPTGKAVDLRFLEVNPAFESQSGLQGAPGRLISELRPVEGEWAEAYGRVATTGESLHLEAQSKALGRWFNVRAYRIGRPEARTVGVLFNDVTEVRQARQRQREQLERLDLLQQVTRAIGERHDLASIYEVVIRALEDRLPVDFGCVCLYSAPDTQIEVAHVGLRSGDLALELAMTEHARVDIDSNGLSRCVRGQLVYEPDVSLVPHPFPQRLALRGLRSLVAAPLLIESEVFGMLIAARREANAFSSSECEFLRQLSEHVALAVNQTKLYTALKAAYEDLRQTQQAAMQQERLRALGEMASGIAHDINNAISPAALYTDSLLERETGLSADGRRQLETIQRAVHDVAATVARMREFYRQREPRLVLAEAQLNELVQQVIDLTRARWSDMPHQRGLTIELITQLQSDLPLVMGMDSEIREALINLVFNAVDAMPQGGTLTLRTRSDDGQRVLVEVSDTGVGMDEDARRRCLEPFFTTKGERGTGLGLAMVYGVLQRHGADIEIDSAPGRGTTVRLTFAVATDPQAVAPSFELNVPKGLRILAIDDDPVLLRSLRETLEADGHYVEATHDGQKGIDLFQAALRGEHPFAVVITDLGMPYVDGRRVADAVKAASAATPVIMLTGWGQRMIADDEIPRNVDLMLGKPARLGELREALARFCGA